MANIFDYLAWRGDLHFSQVPFNPVDGIILSQFSYLPLDGIVPGPDEKGGISIRLAQKIFSEKLAANESDIKSSVMFKEDPALFEALASSARFGDCHLFGYVNHSDISRETQFSAFCLILEDDSSFVVFRGTDFSLVGWKEDFNMSFSEVIPAQIEAAEYLEKMADLTKGPLRLGGHSKGGNLAIYAASMNGRKIQKRITEIYSNDAPGFHESVIEGEGFHAIKDRIKAFIPQSSIIGLLLEQRWDFTVIKSSKVGLMQHELYSWEVMYDNMVLGDKVSERSIFLDKTIKQWVSNCDKKEREKFTNALFTILRASNAKSFTELEKNWLKAAGGMIKTLGDSDNETKLLLRKIIGELFNAAMQNMNAFGMSPKIPNKNISKKQESMEIEIEAKYEDFF